MLYKVQHLINKYKTLDTKDKSEFDVIMEKNDLRDKINELKEKEVIIRTITFNNALIGQRVIRWQM